MIDYRTRLRVLLARLRDWGRARRLDSELREQIASHLEEAAEDYRRRGLSPAEARRAALVSFGGVAQAEGAWREQRSFASLDHLRRDLRHAARALRRSPGSSAAALLVLAIGTGAITAVFALLNAIVVQPLPFPDADRLVAVSHSAPGLSLDEVGLSGGLYFHYREHARAFETLGVYRERELRLTLPGRGTERVRVAYAGVSVLRALGATPALGRLFTDDDGRPGFMDMRWPIPVLLAHDFWVSRLGADPAIVGGRLTIGDRPREVVGVLPEGFWFPGPETEILMLFEPPSSSSGFADSFPYAAIAKLAPGITPAAAEAELARILPRVEGRYRDATPERIAEAGLSPIVVPLQRAVTGDVAHVLWTLFGGMAFLLAIACANAAGLFLARVEHRRGEIAIRQALGAGRRHVARLFVVEALVLSSAAAALGLLLAQALLTGVLALAPAELPRAAEVRLDLVAVLFAGGLAVLSAMFQGALAVRRVGGDVAPVLSGDSRAATGGRAGRWAREPLVAAQVALALVLMSGSALMIATYRNLSQRELGFSPEGVLTMEVGLPGSKAGRHARIYAELVDRVGRLPGVRRASLASFLPLTLGEHVYPVRRGGAPVPFKFFTPGYFETIGTAIVDGAGFPTGERVATSSPVVVSAALARRLYLGERALGRPVSRLNEDGTHVDMGRGPVPPFTIAGVAGDVRETSLRDDPTEVVYIPVVDPPVEPSIVPIDMILIVRASAPPLGLVGTVRQAIAAVDPDLSVGRVRTLASVVRAARAREAFVGALLVTAAAASLLLVVVGVYGSVAQLARRRTREMGIRAALGATRADLVQTMAASVMVAVLAGAALGVTAALAAAGTLRALLFGVAPREPIVLLGMTLSLLAAAMAAALLAARRATRGAPMLAIRGE